MDTFDLISTLVDAGCIEDERYRRGETICQQLAVADLVVANKSDLYGPQDLGNLRCFLLFWGNGKEKLPQMIKQGRIGSD
ncbi:GTP-binding protein [uncultured Microbulbifer sp.]|uniref:GTP-binding protein n=1 Tax=uncultured Microbulbifer sp. TaxID=348147 RepID=UPI00344B0E83